jgi:hypothetical protein
MKFNTNVACKNEVKADSGGVIRGANAAWLCGLPNSVVPMLQSCWVCLKGWSWLRVKILTI